MRSWGDDASSRSQVMKEGSCCAVMNSICENVSAGPAMDQKQFGAGGRRPHRMRGVLLSFNEGDAGRTDVRLCAEQPLVSPDIPMVR